MCCKQIFLDPTRAQVAMKKNMWATLCQLLLFGCMLHYGFANDLPPRFIKDMNGLELSEDTKTGTTVYKLEGVDPEGRTVKYSISASVFTVDTYSGDVTLVRNIDYENAKTIRVTVTISDGLNKVPRNVIVSIKDTNDVIPSFSNETYFVNVPENTPVNQIVLKDIEVRDADGVNSLISVTCNPGTAHQEDCQTFKLERTANLNSNSWKGQLRLATQLNYENKKSYQVPLVAFDGVNNKTQSVEIQVEDVADSPPYFVEAFSVSLDEVDKIGTFITNIKAVDGDVSAPRRIHYEISNGSDAYQYFKINPVNGTITNKVPLDREDSSLRFNAINIDLKVREVISESPLVLGDSASTTATTTIRVTLLDINDNRPVFSSNYTARIPEDILDNTDVPQLWMTVTDADSRLFANYSFQVETFDEIFVTNPKFGEGRSIVGLKVKNASYIDYEKGPRVYNFQIIAREINTREMNSGSTSVTIFVDDVNDNAPRVNRSPLIENIPENAAPGRQIIDIDAVDDDSGNFGTNGIRYVSLKGIGQQLFSLNQITGVVTVSNCPSPGISPCLDYEVKRQYNLTVLIVDNKNNPSNLQKKQVELIINILDENDNAPIFSQSVYYGKILEGNTNMLDDVLVNQVTDSDTVGRLQFSIKTQDVSRLFAINPDTGKLTAQRPVSLTDARNDAYNDVEVTVTDGVKSALATVRIEIIDKNNHKPTFSQVSYKKCISEQFSGGTSVLKVQATDLDQPGTPNSDITYSIVSGADGFFVIEPDGVIKTTFRAIFDYETKQVYYLTVMAKDNGLPPLSATTQVTICIDDFNDVIPYFIPFTVQVNVKENVAVNTEIIQLNAYDADQSAKVQFSFAEPSNAINPNGLTVTKADFDYTNLFRMDPDTGKIFIAKDLNRDRVSLITHTVQAVDTAGVDQTGTGTIIINILDVNKIPPRFTQPWTPSTPFYRVTLNEEQSVGSSVITLNAIDDDGSIEGYELAETKGYFVANKGVVTVNKRIDFEVIEDLSFLAYAWDNVEPKMTATATVLVTIKNINDNNPLFKAPIYSFSIEENSPPGEKVGFVSASDVDKGTYGNVLYSIEDATKSFGIDTFTGEITVTNSTALDREKVGEIIVQVTAYDSPGDPSVRRNSTVPVYITLRDQNDNAPVFDRPSYYQRVEEDVIIGTSIFEISAKDADEGVNAIVTYRKSTGDPGNLFSVASNGVISVRQSLQKKAGVYNFEVIAYSGVLNSAATVTIEVVKGISSPPAWIVPATNNEVINVLESQYKGMFVYRVRAESPDTGPKGRIKYMFLASSLTSQSTNEFYINPLTGVISALRIFDREEKDSYTLQVIAQDSNVVPQNSERRLIIKIIDVNDNKPEFPVSNGQVLPYNFQVKEDSQPVFYIGSVLARDRDLNSSVYYQILSGNSENIFSLNQITGALSLENPVDRDNISSFSLNIEAMDSLTSYDLITPNHIRRLERKWADLNVAHINVEIIDVNDEVPKFSQKDYYGCISADDGLMRSILTVKAIDKDISSDSLKYSFAKLRTQDGSAIKKQILTIGKKNGIIRNQESMNQYKDTVFLMDIIANDTEAKNASDTAKGLIFVTEKSQAVKVVVTQPSTDVHYFVPQIKKLLSQKSDDSYICISDVREHVLPTGLLNTHWKKKTIEKVTYAQSLAPPPEKPNDFTMSSIYHNKGFLPEDDGPPRCRCWRCRRWRCRHWHCCRWRCRRWHCRRLRCRCWRCRACAASLALPLLALPSLALPLLALPSLVLPSLALPLLALPSLAAVACAAVACAAVAGAAVAGAAVAGAAVACAAVAGAAVAGAAITGTAVAGAAVAGTAVAGAAVAGAAVACAAVARCRRLRCRRWRCRRWRCRRLRCRRLPAVTSTVACAAVAGAAVNSAAVNGAAVDGAAIASAATIAATVAATTADDICVSLYFPFQQSEMVVYSTSHGGNSGFQGGNSGFQGGNSGFQGGNSGFQGGNSGFQGGNSGFQGGNSGFQGGNSGFQGGNAGFHDRLFEEEDLKNSGGNINGQHEEIAMAGLGNSGHSRKSLRSRNNSFGQRDEMLQGGLSNNGAPPIIFTFDEAPPDGNAMSQENLHMATSGGSHGRDYPDQFMYDAVSRRPDTPAPYSERNSRRSGQNENAYDTASYGRGSAYDGGMLPQYPASNSGSVHQERLQTPYSRSLGDVSEQPAELISPYSHDGSGKRFAPYVQEYPHGSSNNLTPEPSPNTFDFPDEMVSSDPDDMPLYSVVNKHPDPTPEFPDTIEEPEPTPSDAFSDPEPVITTSIADPVEEPQIECEIEPDVEPEPFQNPDYIPPPPPEDEPVIVTELDEAR
ncbi:cadherin-87A-like isoform X1 [Octopus vulgaris]|uniref:Cadherin-87A-like isoform X1 n=1 Tax=Octopus vulgaris TaxID=6645 RepID=A0AA36AIU8_OCTVU|nr:cadherin-87A-like isoform X1 [Octopus vulgaris]